MIQVTRTGTIFTGSEADLESLAIRFDREHCIRLPQFLEPSLVRLFQDRIDHAEFYERLHNEGIFPPPTDLCMKNDSTAGFLYFLTNDPVLFELIEAITGCPRIGCFCGGVYRLVPGKHYDSWHSDVKANRMVAMSINLSAEIYSGGSLQIRDRKSEKIIHQVANTGFGDAIIFRISPRLQHRVSTIEGAIARTAYAGWFQSQPDFISLLKERSSRRVAGSQPPQ